MKLNSINSLFVIG